MKDMLPNSTSSILKRNPTSCGNEHRRHLSCATTAALMLVEYRPAWNISSGRSLSEVRAGGARGLLGMKGAEVLKMYSPAKQPM